MVDELLQVLHFACLEYLPSHASLQGSHSGNGVPAGQQQSSFNLAASFAPVSESSSGSSFGSIDERAVPGAGWVGAAPEFTRVRKDKERSGMWRTDGLHGVVKDVVQGDEQSAR